MKPHPNDGFAWVDTDAGPALVCRALEPFAPHLFTTRAWTLGSAAPDVAQMRAAWQQVATVLDGGGTALARLRQVHGARVVIRRSGDGQPGHELPEADIIVSTDPSTAIAVQTADCAPILIADPASGAVAAAHAGWRGLAARVPDVAVRALTTHAGAVPARLIAAIGPSISAARYEVGDEVRKRFADAGFTTEELARWFPAPTRPGHWLFDGWASARDQLEAAGVATQQIHVSGMCTATYPDLFCSYRRDGARAGRMAAAIRAR